MPTEIEILYRGLSRKISKQSYSKLRPYNKIKSSRIQNSHSSSENPYSMINYTQGPQEDQLYQEIQILNQSIEKLEEENKRIHKILKREQRLIKLIDPKMKKMKEKKNLESRREDPCYKAKDVENIKEILLQVEVSELEQVLMQKNEEYQGLISKRKNKTNEYLQNQIIMNKREVVSICNNQNCSQLQTFIDKMQKNIKQCCEKKKRMELKIFQSRKMGKKDKLQLQETMRKLKDAASSLQEKKQLVQVKQSQQYLQLKGGEMKNSLCLEEQIQKNQRENKKIERQLNQFMEQKIRKKIGIIREIQVYQNLLRIQNQKKSKKMNSQNQNA